MIYKSNTRLSTIYRRLFFGISAFDLIQSISQAFSSVPMPRGLMWAAAGNHTTCDLQGFAAILGVNGSSLYSLSLSIYFFCVVKQVPEDKLKKLIEPLLHATPILVAMSTAIYLYVGEYYNPSGSICWL